MMPLNRSLGQDDVRDRTVATIKSTLTLPIILDRTDRNWPVLDVTYLCRIQGQEHGRHDRVEVCLPYPPLLRCNPSQHVLPKVPERELLITSPPLPPDEARAMNFITY